MTAIRAQFERRMGEERMHELATHGCRPDWADHFMSSQPRVWTMDRHGAVSRSWEWLDTVDWRDVAAVRLEYDQGQAIDPADLVEDELTQMLNMVGAAT